MKRFTETTKWLDAWFSELSQTHKLAFLYLLDTCDGAGVIDPPGKVASMLIGGEIDWQEFREVAGERIQTLECGKWWIAKFIDYQYKGEVSATSKQHAPVRDSIKRHQVPVDCPSNTQSMGVRPPSNGGQEKEKDKVQEKVTETDQEKVKPRQTDLSPPCTVEQAMSAATQAMIPAEIGEEWWHDRNSKGWTIDNHAGNPRRVTEATWRSDLIRWGREVRDKRASRGRPNGQRPAAQTPGKKDWSLES